VPSISWCELLARICTDQHGSFLLDTVLICSPTRRSLIGIFFPMIRKLQSGEYRLYSRKKDAKTGKRKNLGTFSSRAAAQKHERAVQYFKRAG
jgi:hypothetical protein